MIKLAEANILRVDLSHTVDETFRFHFNRYNSSLEFSFNVVFIRDSVGEKNGQKLTGIRGIYQIRVDNSMEQQCIMHRNITCACNSCVH